MTVGGNIQLVIIVAGDIKRSVHITLNTRLPRQCLSNSESWVPKYSNLLYLIALLANL